MREEINKEKSQFPSIDLIYDMVKEQHEFISDWADSLDNKVAALFGLTTILIGAFTALNKGEISYGWTFVPLGIAALSFVVSSVCAFLSFQPRKLFFGLNPTILLDDYASEVDEETKYSLVKFDGDHWEQNCESINDKASWLNRAIIAAVFEMIALVAWIIVA
jgi:hypothetical protein